jgi:hypothetical protein
MCAMTTILAFVPLAFFVVLSGVFLYLTKQESLRICLLSHKRELDKYVFWNLLFPFTLPHRLAPIFIFPHDSANESVVRAMRKARWTGLGAIVATSLSVISLFGLFLTIFVGPPGAH